MGTGPKGTDRCELRDDHEGEHAIGQPRGHGKPWEHDRCARYGDKSRCELIHKHRGPHEYWSPAAIVANEPTSKYGKLIATLQEIGFSYKKQPLVELEDWLKTGLSEAAGRAGELLAMIEELETDLDMAREQIKELEEELSDE